MNPSRVIRIFLMLALCFAGAAAQTRGKLTPSELGNVLSCLNIKLKAIEYAPPHFEGSTFRVRYVLGVIDKDDDQENELHLVVYGKNEKRANLYQIYFDRDGKPSIYIGEMGTLKREKGIMVPDEIWGGVGTYNQVKRILRVVSAEPAIEVPASEVVPGTRMCIYQR